VDLSPSKFLIVAFPILDASAFDAGFEFPTEQGADVMDAILAAQWIAQRLSENISKIGYEFDGSRSEAMEAVWWAKQPKLAHHFRPAPNLATPAPPFRGKSKTCLPRRFLPTVYLIDRLIDHANDTEAAFDNLKGVIDRHFGDAVSSYGGPITTAPA
jgi:hypothetical protein